MFKLKIRFSLMPAIAAVLATAAHAGNVSIYNNDDSGTGSLRWAVELVNAAGGTNTINWIYGSGGTLTLLSDLPLINGNTTLDASESIYDAVIADSTNSMSLGGAVTFHNNSISSTWTVHENIGGPGSLIKTGDGVLVLTGDNVYAGGTFMNGGVLEIDGDESLGASLAGLSFDGGTLKILADVSSARPVTLDPGGGILNTNSYTLSLSGMISGTGGLEKEGTGTLILGGANTYLGPTTISAGTLELGADNAIPQASTVTLTSGAVLNLGAHTTTIAAYSGAGTLAMRLQPGVTNLSVTGGALIGSSYLYAAFSPQLIAEGQTFTVLSAESITGEFLGVYSPALVSFVPDYGTNPGDMVLTAGLVPFADIAGTPNQHAVGAALEPLRPGASGDLASVIGNLYVLDADGVRAALDQIGPVSLSAMRGLAARGSDMRSAALQARTAHLAAGTAGGFSTYSSRASDPDEISFNEFRRLKKPAPKSPVADRKGGDGGRRPWGFFASAVGITGRNMQDDEYPDARPGYDFSGGGMLLGADYSITEGLATGLIAGYGVGEADVYFPSDARVDSRSASYGGYIAAAPGDLRVDLYAGRGSDLFTTEREISFEDVSRAARASPDGRETNLEAGVSYQFHTATDGGRIAPFITVNHDRLKIDPFTETGADSLNLTVSEINSRSLRSSAGLRWMETIETGDARIRTYISAAWGHEFYDQNLPITASLASGGSPFTVNSEDSVRNAIKTGIRIAADMDGSACYLDYAGDFRKRLYSHSLSLGYSVKF